MNSQSEAYSTHVRAFSELLIRLRSELGKDLDKVLILAVIAERHYTAMRTREATVVPPADPATARKRCGINALSVALYSGIPRETARRKIAALVEKGWVECDASGSLSPTARAANDLAGATAATLKYIHSVTRAEQPCTRAKGTIS